MTTSLNEISEIEKYIFNELPLEKRLLFEAQLIINPGLRKKVILQKKIYTMLLLHHRKKLKGQAEKAFNRLMNDPDKKEFKNEIATLINS